MKVYFIENKKYFKWKKVYLESNNKKNKISDPDRFLFFSLAVIRSLPRLKFKPNVIHLNDYHTSFVSVLLKVFQDKYLENIKSVLTIHNLKYQGKTGLKTLNIANLNKNSLKTLKDDAKSGKINFLLQGILNADIITTVSQSYAKEITTKEFGEGLEKYLRKRKKDLFGILNGIDVGFLNPLKDKNIKYNYSFTTLERKVKNKIFLQKKLGLKVDESVALVGLVSRLVWQKGLDLINDDFAKLDCQFVFLGTGYKDYENHLKKMARKYPGKISTKIMFDSVLANQIYAGADIFLMPSRFEPCGLGQMIAMRYGTVPLVRATGGLKDTVIPYLKNKEGNGFVFKKFDSKSFLKELKRALSLYDKNKKEWRKIQIRDMKKDFSWNNSAKEYLKIYKKLIK